MLGTCGTEQEGTGRKRACFARAFSWVLTESPFHYGPLHVELAHLVTNAEIQIVWLNGGFSFGILRFFFSFDLLLNKIPPTPFRLIYDPMDEVKDITFLTFH